MARDIPISNGCLLVAFDGDYRIRDLYFPHVGQENHVGGHACRFGFFVDGALLDWVAARAAPSGVLPEQVDPFDGTARSVAPLTWSHAEFVFTVRRFVERRAEVTVPAEIPDHEEQGAWAKQ